MDDSTTDHSASSGITSDSSGSIQKPDGPNANDNGNPNSRRRSYFVPQTIAAVIVALAGVVYAMLDLYGAVSGNGSKTEELKNRVSVLQTAIPKIATQLAAIPTKPPTSAPIIIQQQKPGGAPTVVVTQLPAVPGAPGKAGAPGAPGAVKIITVTQSPTPAPTCANSLLGYCIAK